MRIPPNVNDPNGYYAELGLPPWADRRDIKRALRHRMRRFHPDGTDPNPALFSRCTEIADTLLDPANKATYDRLPKGMVLVDSVIQRKADKAGVTLTADVDSEPESTVGTHFDWLADTPSGLDGSVAQRWYRSLLSVAPMFNYTRAIRVLLHDGEPQWLGGADILMVPRSWTPDTGSAFALFAVVVGKQQ